MHTTYTAVRYSRRGLTRAEIYEPLTARVGGFVSYLRANHAAVRTDDDVEVS